MSSSAKPALSPLPAPEPAPETAAFPYRELSMPAGAGPVLTGGVFQEALGGSGPEREAQARQTGRMEGESQARLQYEKRLAAEREHIADALSQFTRERAIYYQKIEAEVVQLALSIARKILHREAQLDPLLLAGVARVALEKIEGATGVVLLVNPQLAEEWRRYLALHLEPGDLPEIVEDPALEPERCVLQTSMGTTELGIDVQLKEIERGLMDLLAARPRDEK